jgi:predicted GH43/DUF377 family glycosyl hydrolase
MTGAAAPGDPVIDARVHLHPDPSRVYAALFMPGEEQSGDHSRATSVINRVLALDDAEVSGALADLRIRFADRPALDETFQLHFDTISPRLGAHALPPADRQLLIGAYFTHDVSPEGAALTNPSIVPHPDQSDLEAGELRFIVSARAIGEGHVSSIEFRTGVVSTDGGVRLDVAGPRFETARQETPIYQRACFWAQLDELGFAGDIAHLVLDDLGDTFDRATLEEAIARRDGQIRARRASRETMSWLRWIADNNYKVTFREGGDISDRILIPTGPTESNGLEDARMVRFVGDDGAATYLATYTAYDGRHLSPQLLRTDDFRTFTAHQLSGPAAKNKGMALFPRLIGGRHACLSRWDRERSFVAWSDDGVTWDSATPIQEPERTWDLIQVGNCGSPLETTEGWLVLTHGVGPMRTYTIGAMLLQLDDPTRVLASLTTPLVTPVGQERNGYVPNVVYTCGAMIHGEQLILPYGFGDQAITISVIGLPDLLGRLADPASSSCG